MTAILALLPSIISLIPTLESGASAVIALIGSIRTAAKQTGEWTPELENQFLESLIVMGTQNAWKPDPKA